MGRIVPNMKHIIPPVTEVLLEKRTLMGGYGQESETSLLLQPFDHTQDSRARGTVIPAKKKDVGLFDGKVAKPLLHALRDPPGKTSIALQNDNELFPPRAGDIADRLAHSRGSHRAPEEVVHSRIKSHATRSL
jgi:hypothetical protein